MTLRLRRHFTTRIASCAFALAFFGTLALVCLVGDRVSTARSTDPAHSQEQEGQKKQVDQRWKIQIPAPIDGQKDKEQKKQDEPLPAPIDGQKGKEQKKQDEPLLRIETELVQIDAVVTDKQGKLARDLKRADFELFDEGKKQEIAHFAIGTAAQPASHLAGCAAVPMAGGREEAG